LASRVSQYLRIQKLPSRVPRLDSIRNRILALAVLGTLIPAAITLSFAYRQNRQALEEKIREDLHSESAQTARAVGVWLKERLYDLRVFAASDEVSLNLGRFAAGQGSVPLRLRDYLRSLHERFPDFERIMVLDEQGRVIASSAAQAGAVALPADWQRVLRQETQIVGDAYWDARSSSGRLIVAVPVQRPDGRLLGAFAAELSLAPLREQLRSFAADSGAGGSVFLIEETGRVVTTSAEMTEQLMQRVVAPATLRRLTNAEHGVVTYRSGSGIDVLGTMEKVPQARWSVVSEKSEDAAFQQVNGFRNIALLVTLLLLAIVAGTAYRLGIIIVRPLERLAEGAAEVSMGALDVDLPAGGGGEVGALTRVFNHMVATLRRGRHELASANDELRSKNAELERLSVTDGLTGLTNHRALMQRLGDETARAHRTGRPFSFMMCDVDHFKGYNDEFGHPAGDEVLRMLATILRDATRNVDCAARYGGEEFAVILSDTDLPGAMEVAERIRKRVEATNFPSRGVTVSIGVAEFPRDAVDANSLVEVADEALYLAKDAGRNQVVQAKRQRKQKLPSPTSMRAKKPVVAAREVLPAKPAPTPKTGAAKNGNGKKKKG
jgi:diguanylate cyclase (GGDEF)-like protein